VSQASPPSAPPGGPYLQTAVLCEKVLQEQDGVLSLVRIVDRIISTALGPDPPEDMPPVAVNLTAVIVLKSGQAPAHRILTVVRERRRHAGLWGGGSGLDGMGG
jgi:hypothetical protein